MRSADRYRLHFGPYRTPRFRYGAIVQDAIRGDVRITGLTDALIPWPIGVKVGGGSAKAGIVLYGVLAKAVQKESNLAVAHWWGVTGQTVTRWRKALGVGRATAGSSRLWADHAIEQPRLSAVHERSRDPVQDTGRRTKIAAAKQGKPRPPHIQAKLRTARIGQKASKATRQKMSQSHRQRGTRPPWLNPAWSVEEDALVRRLPAKEAAAKTGRSLAAVYCRRSELGVPRDNSAMNQATKIVPPATTGCRPTTTPAWPNKLP